MRRLPLYMLSGLVWLMMVVTACEDKYRNIVFFNGAEPVYQVGTCDNLLTSATLYLSDDAPTKVGVDGGDGRFTLSCTNSSVVSAVLMADSNGHSRVSLTPKAEGVANVVVTDANGDSAMLAVHVRACFRLVYRVRAVGFGLKNGDIDDAQWQLLCDTLRQMQPVRIDGCYELQPDNRQEGLASGRLKVYPEGGSGEFISGSYAQVEGIDGEPCLRFSYDSGETHVFSMRNPLDWPASQPLPLAPMLMWEEVTQAVEASLPSGCRVYRAEEWLLQPVY